jgi:Tol biopolymer transport system component
LHNKTEQIIYSRQRTSEDILCVDVSPDNKTIILSLTDVIEGEKLARMEKYGGSPQILIDYTHGEPYRGISWSPDGKKIAVVRGRKNVEEFLFDLYVMSPQGTDIKRISDINLYLGKPSWSPDSKKIIFTGYGSMKWTTKGDEEISKKGEEGLNIGIFMVDIETGIANKIIDSGFSPAWSPDGRIVAYYEPVPNSNRENLNLFNMESKEIKTIFKAGWFGNSIAWSPDGKYILFPRFKNFAMGRQFLEVYSLDQKKSFRIVDTEGINDIVWK